MGKRIDGVRATGKSVDGAGAAWRRTDGACTAESPSDRAIPTWKAAGSPHARAARRYLIAAVGCALFALIYAQFSHDVHSPFMTFMFAIPLVGGTLPALACHLAKARRIPRLSRQAWALSIACLTIGSCLRGIFDIAGTSSALLIAYPLAAAPLAIVAIVVSLRRKSLETDNFFEFRDNRLRNR